jgi:hypothetical protein
MDGILRDDEQKQRISNLHERGDHFALKTSSGSTLGLVSSWLVLSVCSIDYSASILYNEMLILELL